MVQIGSQYNIGIGLNRSTLLDIHGTIFCLTRGSINNTPILFYLLFSPYLHVKVFSCSMLYVVRISGRRNVDGHRTYGSLPDSAFFHSFVCQTSLFQLKIVYQAITWFENFYYYWMKLLPFQFWEYHLVSE